jgi:hypothetical protein
MVRQSSKACRLPEQRHSGDYFADRYRHKANGRDEHGRYPEGMEPRVLLGLATKNLPKRHRQ